MSRSGVTTCRGSKVPAAASGRNGVYRAKFVSLTSASRADCFGITFSSSRAAAAPPKPPPAITTFQAIGST